MFRDNFSSLGIATSDDQKMARFVTTLVLPMEPDEEKKEKYAEIYRTCMLESGYPVQAQSTRAGGPAISATMAFTINGQPLCTAVLRDSVASCQGKVKKFKGNPLVGGTLSGKIGGADIRLVSEPTKIKQSKVLLTKASYQSKGKYRILKLSGQAVNQKKPVAVLAKPGKKFQNLGSAKVSAKGKWTFTKKFAKRDAKSLMLPIQIKHSGTKIKSVV